MGRRATVISIFILMFLVSVVSALSSYYFYSQYQKMSQAAGMSEESRQKQMIDKIGTVFQLPGEKPTIVRITDRDKLLDQAFFQKAQNGDMIIVYEKARRILLFRPSLGKVIDFAPLILNETANTSAGNQAPAPGFDMFRMLGATASATPTATRPSDRLEASDSGSLE